MYNIKLTFIQLKRIKKKNIFGYLVIKTVNFMYHQ